MHIHTYVYACVYVYVCVSVSVYIYVCISSLGRKICNIVIKAGQLGYLVCYLQNNLTL